MKESVIKKIQVLGFFRDEKTIEFWLHLKIIQLIALYVNRTIAKC